MATPKIEDIAIPNSEVESLEVEAKRLQNEILKLEVKEKLANLQDLEERLAERELKRETRRQVSKTNGATIAALNREATMKEARCNHKKGGNGLAGLKGGKGTDSQYAILQHTFANGDMWIRCLRCGKTWKPPVRRAYKTEDEYNIAAAKYELAKEFQTNNSPSSSYLFRYSDNGEFYREVTESTNLR
jgi:hypothetical protein